jgi:hypothetical protein
MATAEPFVKLLRQLSSARDDFRTGGLDIAWDGCRASLHLVFGQPSHATLDTAEGDHLEGDQALGALGQLLPPRFEVTPWRDGAVPSTSLSCSFDELAELIAGLSGAAAASDGQAAGLAATTPATSPAPDFGPDGFPPLPGGASLWDDVEAGVVHLDQLLARLPDAIVTLSGPGVRAAGIVADQRLVDAVWVDGSHRLTGEPAAARLRGATQGSVSGRRLDDPSLIGHLGMLWRYPAVLRDLPAAWLSPEDLLADLAEQGSDCALVVSGETPGAALLAGGELVAVWSAGEPAPVASPARLAALLRVPGASVTVRRGATPATVEPGVPATASAPAPAEPASAGSGLTPSTPPTEPGAARAAVSTPPVPAAPPAPPAEPDAARIPVSTPPAPADPAWVAAAAMPRSVGDAPAAAATPAWAGPAEPEPAWAGPAEPAMAPPRPRPAPATPQPARPASASAPAPRPVSDYDDIKHDLVRICALWLGTEEAAATAARIEAATASVQGLMTVIEAVGRTPVPGQDPTVVRAMAQEMRMHAAERLSGLRA